MKKEINVLASGNIYFFYRPKVESKQNQKEEVQRFFLVLHPQKSRKYHLIIIGKKHLPQEKGENYFGFVEAIKKNKNDLLQSLTEKHYTTATHGERLLPDSHCLGAGKFLIASHNNHTHFIYQLTNPKKIKSAQNKFHIKAEEDYLISVKNPQIDTPKGVGLAEKQKADYPNYLQTKFSEYHFIPLNPADFLDYEGTELLLIAVGKENLTEREKEISSCLERICSDRLLEEFIKITPPEAVAPIEE